jgi:hypothetical protein
MTGAWGEHMNMSSIIIGRETVDNDGKSLLFVVPGDSVSSPGREESLINASASKESGFDVVFRIAKEAILDGIL